MASSVSLQYLINTFISKPQVLNLYILNISVSVNYLSKSHIFCSNKRVYAMGLCQHQNPEAIS